MNTEETLRSLVGKTIQNITIDRDGKDVTGIVLAFSDGSSVTIEPDAFGGDATLCAEIFKGGIANGTYHALWGGYVITATLNGEEIRLKTKNGIRGMDYPVKITLMDGVWTASEESHGRIFPIELVN